MTPRRTSGVWLLAFGVVGTAVWMRAAAPDAPPVAATPTFSESVAPILYANCVTCHRPGQAAPFSLISYEDVRKRGTTIARATKARYMPPWHAEHGYGEFADERRLTDAQIETIGAWVTGGMPQGDMKKMPALPAFADGWQLGKPDLVLDMPVGFEVPADGPDVYRNFVLPTGLTEDKFVRAVEFHAGSRSVVHHALFQYIRGGSAERFLGKDGQPGFKGAMLPGLAPGFNPTGSLGGWAVGTTPRSLPDGIAWPIAKNSDIIIQEHFHPTGKAETERSTIGLYFAATPPERKIFTPAAPGLFGLLANIDIPPGEKNYVITAKMNVPANMRAVTVMAHAHYLGKEFKATATLPDGGTVPLLWIKNWDFNWQDRYQYKTPVALPKDTKIDISISYDNSADNPHQPCRPARRVQWGLQSLDEMGVVQFEMVAATKAAEDEAQAAYGAAVRAGLQRVGQEGTAAAAMQRYADQQRQFMNNPSMDGCGPAAPVFGVSAPTRRH